MPPADSQPESPPREPDSGATGRHGYTRRSDLAERALRQQNAFLKALIDAMPDMIFVKDRDFRITLVNRAFCEASGRPEEEILGKTAHELYPKEIADVFHAMDLKLFSSGETNRNEEWFVSADGRRMRLDTTKVPYCNSEGEVVGIMAIARDVTERTARDEERQILVQQLKSAMRELGAERQKLREANAQLTQISQRDGLTGVHNRLALDERLASEWNRCRREEMPLAVILADIDHFKLFNDTYGHLAGDDCLRKVAQLLQDNVHRSADFVARYGGEEFAILLSGNELEEATLVAEACRKSLYDLAIPHEGAPEIGRVTLSAGVASMQPDADHAVEQLLQTADEQLYLAKRTRNTVRS